MNRWWKHDTNSTSILKILTKNKNTGKKKPKNQKTNRCQIKKVKKKKTTVCQMTNTNQNNNQSKHTFGITAIIAQSDSALDASISLFLTVVVVN